jgi:hypothetical protein
LASGRAFLAKNQGFRPPKAVRMRRNDVGGRANDVGKLWRDVVPASGGVVGRQRDVGAARDDAGPRRNDGVPRSDDVGGTSGVGTSPAQRRRCVLQRRRSRCQRRRWTMQRQRSAARVPDPVIAARCRYRPLLPNPLTKQHAAATVRGENEFRTTCAGLAGGGDLFRVALSRRGAAAGVSRVVGGYLPRRAADECRGVGLGQHGAGE